MPSAFGAWWHAKQFAFGLLGAMSTGGVKARVAASTLSLALRFRAQNRLDERDVAITTELVPDPSEKNTSTHPEKNGPLECWGGGRTVVMAAASLFRPVLGSTPSLQSGNGEPGSE